MAAWERVDDEDVSASTGNEAMRVCERMKWSIVVDCAAAQELRHRAEAARLRHDGDADSIRAARRKPAIKAAQLGPNRGLTPRSSDEDAICPLRLVLLSCVALSNGDNQ